jgi:hypothetical protein
VLIPLIYHHNIREEEVLPPVEVPRVGIGDAIYAGCIQALRPDEALIQQLGWTIVETVRDARGYKYFGYGPLRVVTYFQDSLLPCTYYHTYFYRMSVGMELTPSGIRNNWPQGGVPRAFS